MEKAERRGLPKTDPAPDPFEKPPPKAPRKKVPQENTSKFPAVQMSEKLRHFVEDAIRTCGITLVKEPAITKVGL